MENVTFMKDLEEVLKQDETQPVPMEEQVMILYALQHGFLENVEPVDVKPKLVMLIAQIRMNRDDVVQKLIEGQEMTDEIREGLDEQIARANSAV